MGKILALSGKKQSGKNTSANFLLGMKMIELGLTHGIEITPQGGLWIKDLWNDKEYDGVFNYYSTHETVQNFIEDNINPYIKLYSFADLLKRSVCIDLLGLAEEQCYGTDEQKNEKTELLWENMPGWLPPTSMGMYDLEEVKGRMGKYYDKIVGSAFVFHEPGPMTGREVMQYVGTDIFRRMYGDVWAQSTINRIVKENTDLAVICDCRFPNEVKATQDAGGKVVRFLRHLEDTDEHASETALDEYEGYDATIDNREMKIGQQNGALYSRLLKWNFPVMALEGLETNL